MKVRFTIYSVKFGLVFGIAGFVLQYAIKHFTYLTIMKSMMARIDCILGLVGLIGMLIATIAFIAEISKRIINHDNLFNFFKAIFLTALIKTSPPAIMYAVRNIITFAIPAGIAAIAKINKISASIIFTKCNLSFSFECS